MTSERECCRPRRAIVMLALQCLAETRNRDIGGVMRYWQSVSVIIADREANSMVEIVWFVKSKVRFVAWAGAEACFA